MTERPISNNRRYLKGINVLSRIFLTSLLPFLFAGLAWSHEAPSTSPEKKEYISEYLKLIEIQAEYIKTYSDDHVPAIRYAIKNSGIETLTKIKVVVYFLDKEGNAFFEEDYLPIWASEHNFNDRGPLKPNYTFRMKKDKWMTATNLGDEWGGEIKIEITDVEFSE